ncbi:MAG: ATP-dependent sacrificial sulfur transferase LarE [candidate division WOR-3 bacterium]|nr:ATP-dependent sacrificial sulfur transferase LarE [candidate division WOR-3 bacterium]
MESLTKFVVKNQKVARLKKILEECGSVLVSFSGGVDSSFLLKAAKDFLGVENVLAVIADSFIYPKYELKEAEKLAKKLGVKWKVIKSSEISNKNFISNPPNRCYFCKKALFKELKRISKEEGLNEVIDGTNREDIEGYRPGLKAAGELGIKSPLNEAGMKKKDIRKFSRKIGLETWNKPSFACLASRFPYGIEITRDRLRRVEKAERILISMGFNQLRVRYHVDIARIEVPEQEFLKILKKREEIIQNFKELGYNYITLDIEGYRSGSLNEVLGRKNGY